MTPRTFLERPWHAQYPPGVPADIDPARYTSLIAMFDETCATYPDRPAFGNFGVFLDYARLQARTRSFAAWLQHTLHVAPGDRVALMLPNVLQYPVAMLGALRAGAVVVNVNPLYTPRELKHQLNDAGARVIVVFDAMLHTLASVLHETPVETVVLARIGDLFPRVKRSLYNFVSARRRGHRLAAVPGLVSFRDGLSRGRTLETKAVDIQAGDIAFLQYTGGTTGVSKGAMLSHRNMIANALQTNAWMNIAARAGEEIAITALPLYHVLALSLNCFSLMALGGMNYLITNPRDVDQFVREMARVPFTGFFGVNTLYASLLNAPEFRALDFSTLRLAGGGGSAVQRPIAERWHEITGTQIIEGYGLTESSGALIVNPVTAAAFSGTIGVPLPSTECEIRDESGQPVPPGTPGEIWARGPQLMQGYWQRPADTAEVLTADGWLKTGDIGVMHANGTFEIVDRKKDMILVSGFNVFPNEIEEVLAMHPAVLESAVVGVPDEKSGEAVKAFVVVNDRRVTAEELIAHCREHLTGYKLPRQIVFADGLPKSNVGKILRRELRDAGEV
jgi:long-chain acyl-CoA synthetase